MFGLLAALGVLTALLTSRPGGTATVPPTVQQIIAQIRAVKDNAIPLLVAAVTKMEGWLPTAIGGTCYLVVTRDPLTHTITALIVVCQGPLGRIEFGACKIDPAASVTITLPDGTVINL